jgi:hypothetical protein
MKKIYLILVLFGLALFACDKEEITPNTTVIQDTTTGPVYNPNDSLVKFTLYSNRVPFIWKRVVNGLWLQDTIKTNNAVKYEPFITNNFGVGYWVTMNLAGIPSDSLHIIGEYKGKSTQMASPKYQSAAYVLLDNIKP